MEANGDRYQHGRTDARLDAIEAMLAEVRQDVKALLYWRAWTLGAAAAVSAVVSFLFGCSNR